jgi:glycopeptide antibiotics resistance protein
MKLQSNIAVLSPYIDAATAGPLYPNVFYNCTHFISNWRVIKYVEKRVFLTFLLRTWNLIPLKITLGGDEWNVALMDWPPSWNDLL